MDPVTNPVAIAGAKAVEAVLQNPPPESETLYAKAQPQGGSAVGQFTMYAKTQSSPRGRGVGKTVKSLAQRLSRKVLVSPSLQMAAHVAKASLNGRQLELAGGVKASRPKKKKRRR